MSAAEDIQIEELSAADRLKQDLETYEDYERQKADLVEFQKALLDNLKGDGFDTKVFKKIVSLRRKNPDDLEEEAAILQTYMSALEIEIKGVIA
jgi:uncharacterized protein (UPF0335 family)